MCRMNCCRSTTLYSPTMYSPLINFRKGIADEQLAQKELERGRKRALDESEPPNGIRKRPRSISSSSSTSVSTISTTLSRSASPKRPRLSDIRPPHENHNRKRRRSSSYSDASDSSDYSYPQRRKSHEDSLDRNTRRRRSSNSPGFRGRDRDVADKRRPPRSRSDSMDKGQIARHRNSMTPDVRPTQDRSNGRAPERHRRFYPNDDDRYGSSYRDRGRGERDEPSVKQPHAPPVRKERSLSPFSKRLALTQAMNMGR